MKKKHWTVVKREEQARKTAEMLKRRDAAAKEVNRIIESKGFTRSRGGNGYVICSKQQMLGHTAVTLYCCIGSSLSETVEFTACARIEMTPGKNEHYSGGYSGGVDISHFDNIDAAIKWCRDKIAGK